jgi:transcriptional regulator with XRE-family HTH domain
MNFLPTIDLDIAARLKSDPKFRQAYFLAESSGMIARQLIGLRKRRGKSQEEIAKQLETRQPAISRVESADYRNWSFNTLRRLAEAMDARLRVIIEPSEDILGEYEGQKEQAKSDADSSDLSNFNRLLKKDDAPSPPKPKITQDNDSAAAFDSQIKQRQLRSVLDEKNADEGTPRQKDYREMAGAAWN